MVDYYLRLAWRRCCSHRATSALIVLTLAIGIAACMTALTIEMAFSGEAIPGVSSHLYVVTMAPKRPNYVDSNLMLRDAKALVDARRGSAQAAVAATATRIVRANGHDWVKASGVLAYGQVLRTFGVPLQFGRSWTAQELRSQAPVVIIDTRLARHLFGTADAVGRSVRMGRYLFRVIGVTAPWQPRMRFSAVEQADSGPIGAPVQLFVPVGAALAAGVEPVSSGDCGHSGANMMYGSVNVKRCRWLEMWVALKTPAVVAAYTAFLHDYAVGLHQTDRFKDSLRTRLYSMHAWIAQNGFVSGNVSLDTYLTAAFLLLCMTNVIGLLTARFLHGQRTTAIRRALGASRRQVLLQHLVESTALGISGGVLALPLTWLGMWLVRQQPVGYAPAAHFSPWVFVGLLVLSLFVGAVVGLWPAWRICHQPPALRIKES